MATQNVVCMEYYSVFSTIKKKEILPFATAWMELQQIMLSEISQTGKDKYCCPSVSAEGLFQEPLNILKSADSKVP